MSIVLRFTGDDQGQGYTLQHDFQSNHLFKGVFLADQAYPAKDE
jgi:hypothetical protein